MTSVLDSDEESEVAAGLTGGDLGGKKDPDVKDAEVFMGN